MRLLSKLFDYAKNIATPEAASDPTDKLREALLQSGPLTPEDEEILRSPGKLRDMLAIPDGVMDVIGAYGKVLAEDHRLLHPISLLPYPKETIKHSIQTALNCSKDPTIQQLLNGVLFALEDFVPDEKVPQDPKENMKAWWAHRSGHVR